MTSRHDVTRIHMALNYTCPNISLSSTAVLLGPLYHLAHSEGCFVPLGIKEMGQISFSLCLGGGEDVFAACFSSTACRGRYGRSVTRTAHTATQFPLLPMWFWCVCIESYFPQPINLPGHTSLGSLTSSAFQWVAFGFIVARDEYFSCRSFSLTVVLLWRYSQVRGWE